MENNKITEGGDLMLFVKVENKIYTLAFATSHKLTINSESVDVTNKDHGGGTWVSKNVKRLSWSLSSENLYIEKSDVSGENQKAFGDIFDLMTKREAIEVMFSPKGNLETSDIPLTGWTNAETGNYTGKAIITSLEANAPSGDNATYSVTLEGSGELKHDAPLSAGA